jgi:hypothetical protein
MFPCEKQSYHKDSSSLGTTIYYIYVYEHFDGADLGFGFRFLSMYVPFTGLYRFQADLVKFVQNV